MVPKPNRPRAVGFLSTWSVYQGTTIDHYTRALLQGICAAAREAGCHLLLGCGIGLPAAPRSTRTAWAIPGPTADFVPVGPWNTDGLIIVPDDLSDAQFSYVQDLIHTGFPVVLTTAEKPGPIVAVDNADGMRQAIAHLVQHGHQRIAFIAGKSGRGGDSAERLAAYRAAVRTLGLAQDERLIAFGEHRREDGRRAMQQILAADASFTAVLASNDLSALGALEVLAAAGRRVPEDVAVIGFDDIPEARSHLPPLTTVRHPTFDLGRQAVLSLLAAIEGARPAAVHTRVPTQLVIRQSCGCRPQDFEPEGAAGTDAADAAGWSDRARLELAYEAQRRTTDALLRDQRLSNRLGLMTSQLLNAPDVVQSAAVLAEHLAELGLEHVFVALYAPREDDPYAAADTLLSAGLPEAQVPRQFATHGFPPSGLYPASAPVQLALLPFIVDEHVSGFAAFSATNLDSCAAIVHNLAAAVRMSRLYQEAVAGRRLAEEANRLKSRFLSMVSHELRIPLSLIVGLSDMIVGEQRRQPEVSGATLRDLVQINASAQHLARLIGDVLDLASSEAGQLRILREPLDLAEVLQVAAASGAQLAHDKGLDWRADLPARGPWVMGDRTRLGQVALNLITNAIKFTERGTVCLALTATEGAVTVAVSDTGIGILPADQALLFHEFQRTERTIQAGYGGMGLGLAISKQLVEAHGGAIGVRSPGDLGAGATFSFTLPALTAPTAPAPAGSTDFLPALTDALAAAHAAGELLALNLAEKPLTPEQLALALARHGAEREPRVVLVVDDDPHILDLHCRLVERAGCRALRAQDGRAALDSIAQTRPDLILLDLMMPVLDGFGVLDALRASEATRNIPVLVLTAAVLSEADVERLNRGVTAILGKGLFDADETLRHMEAALAHRRTLGGPTQQLVRRALVFIQAHYAEPLTREDIAGHVGISPDYLTDCFRQELGVTPMAYLNRYRLLQARELLANSDLKITQVAFAVGFHESAHFTRTFQREVGVSPRAYRQGRHAQRPD